jgi:hypothetical protein
MAYVVSRQWIYKLRHAQARIRKGVPGLDRQDKLLAAMNPELDPEARKRVLANMKSRGILEEGAGKWRAVW